MNPIKVFDAALDRANHFLTLYDLLRDTRRRQVRRDWAANFKKCMHWPESEEIARIDGKDCNSILILRESLNIDRTRFTHKYLSELLRAAVVAAVSALDRYMHDLIVRRCWAILTQAEEKIPREMRDLKIPALDARKALDRLRKDRNSRPGYVFKQSIQEVLHRDFTFQNSDAIQNGAKMLGVSNFWSEVAARFPGHPTKKEIIKRLNQIARRRNQIVHEADIERKIKTTPTLTLRDIKRTEAKEIVDWVKKFADAIENIMI